MAKQSRRLGDILVECQRLSEPQLSAALKVQEAQGGRLGEILCQMGCVERGTIRQTLAEQHEIETVDPLVQQPAPDALALVSADVASKYQVLPMSVAEGVMVLAMADPFDREALDVVRMFTGLRVDRRYCEGQTLADALAEYYGSNVARMIATLGHDDMGSEQTEVADLASHLQALAREPTVVNLVNLIIHEAIEAQASDIHVEPFEKVLKVKYRIDGILHEMTPPPKPLQSAIISRLKVMGGMNIAERYVPQDGHIDFNTPRGKVDIRVATVPTVFGESIVLRILDRTASLFDLDHLGLGANELKTYRNLLHQPHGVVLVTGPTGSGKSTTLYGSLMHIYSPHLKILTIEDPVEYQLEGVNQIPVNPKRGVTFADGLRAILRQDPDVIMVGEIRDQETADIAIRAALTGHMVFSTLHTNDAAGAITRLVDMDVEPFLLASSLRAVLAQRLVRKICEHCKCAVEPSASMLERLGHRPNGYHGDQVFYAGTGCRECRQTGYNGRLGIFELLVVNDKVSEAIAERASAVQMSALMPTDHVSMAEDGYQKALRGLTTLEEVFRVTQEN